MKDNEIIKALECWCERNCKEICPKTKSCENCVVTIIKQSLDLINRQKAEIERLQKRLKKERNQFANVGKLYSEVRAEAIKEFAEKVKPILREMFNLMIDDDEGKCIIEDCKKHSSLPCMNEYCIKENLIAWETKIDNLVKEMTEVSE